MTQITQEFNEPFNNATSSLSSNAGGSVVGIDGRAYLIDSESDRYRQVGIDVLQQRNTSSNRDILLLPQNIWRQSQESWSSGAGQDNLDRDDSIQSRFDTSYGIDPWTKWEFKLLPATDQLDNLSASGTASAFLNVHDDNLVVAVDKVAKWYSDLDATPITLNITSNRIINSTYDGNEVVYLDSVGDIWKAPNSASVVLHKSEPNATFVAFVKDYLITASNNVLKDITGTTATIYTHPTEGFRWYGACEGPNAIYVVGHVGDRTTIHRVGVREDGTGLNPAVVAATLPDGEIGYSIGSYLGYVFIGTDRGVRMAAPQPNGELVLGAIIPTTKPVYDFEGQDRFVWFTNSEIDAQYSPVLSDEITVFPTNKVCGLGRMDLSTFTSTALTPAWANDIVAEQEFNKVVSSVAYFKGKAVFAVSEGGVYYESETLMPGGWMIQGTISFSVEDLKAALYMNAVWKPSCAGRLYIDLAYDSSGFGRFGNVPVSPNKIRSDNLNLNGTGFSRVNVRYVITRCPINPQAGPVISRWEIRSSPIKGRASRWEVPVVNHDEIMINGVKEVRDPVLERERLLNLVRTGRVFIYQESGQAYQVMARDFEWRPTTLSMNGSGWQGVFLLVVEEVL
jgi:hypothetical protein